MSPERTSDDALTPDEVQERRARVLMQQSAQEDAVTFAPEGIRGPHIIAYGDSWFDYPPGLDIVQYLKEMQRYRVTGIAHHGYTLENLAYGTEYYHDFTPQRPRIFDLVERIGETNPDILLISAGGSDYAGYELEGMLRHAHSGDLQGSYLYRDYVALLHANAEKAYEEIIRKAKAAHSKIRVVVHGYGNPIPDGRAVINAPFGFRFFGPWLRPAFTKKRIMALGTARAVMVELMEGFNAMLQKLVAKNPETVTYVDFRQLIQDEDWTNELHVRNSAYERLAKRIAKEIDRLAPSQ